MSDLFSRIYTGVVTGFRQAEAEIEAVWNGLGAIPDLKPIEDAAKTALKQEVSNAFAFIDGALKPHFGEALSMAESAFDTGLLGIVGGLSPAAVPLAARATPLINAGITQLANQLRAAVDHAEAEAKAKWNLPTPTSAGIVVMVTDAATGLPHADAGAQG